METEKQIRFCIKMNRPIKFRVWDFKTRKFCQECFFVDSNGKLLIDKGEHESSLKECDYIKYKEQPRYFLQFFSGLKDRNDIEIYEGDIIELNHKFGVVEYRNDLVSFQLGNEFGTVEFNKYSKNLRVLGNIFENADLLNNEKT